MVHFSRMQASTSASGRRVGVVVERVGGGDERARGLRGQLGQLAQAAALVAAIGEGGGEIDAAARGGAERAQALDESRREIARRDGDEDLPLARRPASPRS